MAHGRAVSALGVRWAVELPLVRRVDHDRQHPGQPFNPATTFEKSPGVNWGELVSRRNERGYRTDAVSTRSESNNVMGQIQNVVVAQGFGDAGHAASVVGAFQCLEFAQLQIQVTSRLTVV